MNASLNKRCSSLRELMASGADDAPAITAPGTVALTFRALRSLVEQTIDMPDYLRSQLPDLFPEVVDNVLPKMLPMITSKYVPILFDYLRQ